MATRRALTPEDKDRILGIIGEAWKAQPDQRLGQLIASWSLVTTGGQDDLGLLAGAGDAELAAGLFLFASQRGDRPDGG